MMPARSSMSLTMPNWSLSIQAHIFAETTVGIAHGTSIAARISPRPGSRALTSSAIATPSTVSMATETNAKTSVLRSARSHCGSVSTPYQCPSLQAR